MFSKPIVAVGRASYLHHRTRELFVKSCVSEVAKHRSDYGPFAVVPTEFIGLNVIANGLWERHHLAVTQRLIQRHRLGDTIALDIGANIGNHTVVFSRWFHSVIAFEPNPSVALLLETNLELAGCRNVIVQRVGLGASDGVLPFSTDLGGNDGKGSFAVQSRHAVELPVRNGDGVLAALDEAAASGERRIGFIKCDVEGFESSVFAGLQQTLKRHCPLVVFESNDAEAGTAALTALEQAGYHHAYVIRETGDDCTGRFNRELRRLISTYKLWLEPIEHVPRFSCNVVAATHPITY